MMVAEVTKMLVNGSTW